MLFWTGVGVGITIGVSLWVVPVVILLYSRQAQRDPKVLRDAQEEVDKAWGASEATYRNGG